LRKWNKATPLALADLADAVGGQLEGDGTITITGAAPLQVAGPGDISFLANPKYASYLETTKAGAVVVAADAPSPPGAAIRHDNPYLAFAMILELLHPTPQLADRGVHVSAVISADAKVDPTSSVGPLCRIDAGASVGPGTALVSGVYVGAETEVGSDCLIYPNVTLMPGCIVGDRVIIHAGAVVGSDGFGFAPSPEGLHKVRQVGWVEIEEDVEIGANVTIDRGALGPTRIGAGTKIDNLVQIAHNVEIGRHTVIVSQVGISGSTKIGDGVRLGGQVGIVGHIEIGDGASVGAGSGVARSVPAGATHFGAPARDIKHAKREMAAITRLPDLLKRVRALEKKLADD